MKISSPYKLASPTPPSLTVGHRWSSIVTSCSAAAREANPDRGAAQSAAFLPYMLFSCSTFPAFVSPRFHQIRRFFFIVEEGYQKQTLFLIPF